MDMSSGILIIEDSPDDYEACVSALTQDNNLANQIHWCKTGDEALKLLLSDGSSSTNPSLIMLDLNLPGTDGRDVLSLIKKDAKTKKIPVIVMTSSRDEADIEAAYLAGANSYVVKPVDLDGFFKAISRLRDYWFKIVVLPSRT